MDIMGKFFPVGHGLTYAFKIEKHHMLFDISKQCNLIELEKFYGNKEINFMILSHFHNDHMGGVCDLYKAGFSIEKIYIPYLDDDEQLFVELRSFLRNGIYHSYSEIIESLPARIEEVDEDVSLKEGIWEFNIHQNKGNSKQIINDIKNQLKVLGIIKNDDVRQHLQSNSKISSIKKAYQNVMKKSSLNETSIFLEHGPIKKEIKVKEFRGFEYLNKNIKKGKIVKTHSLITGDMNLVKNHKIILKYYD